MNTLIINSAKGGVGKSATTKLIAKELSKSCKVAIMDLDISTPNIGGELKEEILVLSPEVPRQMTKKQIEKYIRSSLRGLKDIDFLLIDTPPTLNDSYTAIVEVIINAKILYVTTPSKNAKKDTGVGVRYFKARGVDPIGVVQNMVGDIFGEEFDTVKEYGIPTIGVIPLTKDLSKLDLSWVSKIKDAKYGMTSITKDEVIFSKLTIEEVKEDELLPLKFYNLETWDIMRDRILDNDELAMGHYEGDEFVLGALYKSRYDVSTKELEKIINEGTSTNILIKEDIQTQDAPMKWEIQEAQIVYDNPASKGLPMFLLKNGAYLWIQEVEIVDDSMIRDYLSEGAFNLGDGRIVPGLFNMIYLNRAFERGFGLEKTEKLSKRYIDEIPNIDKKYILRTFASLENIEITEWDQVEKELLGLSEEYSKMIKSILEKVR